MKVVLFLAVFVLFNSFCTSTELKEDDLAQTPAKKVEEDIESIDSDFDDEVEDVSDVKETDAQEDEDDDDEEDDKAETSDVTTKEVGENGDEKVIKSQGVIIRLGKKGIQIILAPNGGKKGYVTYTRWGKFGCRRGAKRIYQGYAGGGWFNQRGNGANYLCLPRNPQYRSTVVPVSPSLLYGSEYETGNRIFSGVTQNFNVPCAVCHVRKTSHLVIPARLSCPRGWYREYFGYLMTSHVNHFRTGTYECVDANPDRIPGSARNTNGALFYFVQAQCGHGLPCGPYITRRAITCAVCTK